MLSPEEIKRLIPAETTKLRSPIPTQAVSSDEFIPGLQTPKQREFEERIKRMGASLAKKQGISRRAFFQSAAGMAAGFMCMNETFGPLYLVSQAEAATPELANQRASSLKGQFIMDKNIRLFRSPRNIRRLLH